MMNLNKVLLIQLNEANFWLFKKYKNKLRKYKNLNKVLNLNKLYTDDEDIYEYQEPWIKWMSFYLGVKSKIHKVFRLGHGQPLQQKSIFHNLEKIGYNIGVLMSMNYKNDIKKNNFFISDPWTYSKENLPKKYQTFIDCLKRNILKNSENKISNKDKFIILINLLMLFPFRDYLMLFISVFKSLQKPWIKALILDCALTNLYLKIDIKYTNKKFNFIFLNSIAHIQHRYMLNSKFVESSVKNPEWLIKNNIDPIEDSFFYLDYIFKKLTNKGAFIVMNGFSQIPYDRIKFYWRIKDLNKFFKSVGLKFNKVDQKMTRDFELHFDTLSDLNEAKSILTNAFCKSNNLKIFNDISANNLSLFGSLSYPYEVKNNDLIIINDKSIEFNTIISFVAIKNAMHSSKGVVFFSEEFKDLIDKKILEKSIDISLVNPLILNLLQKK